MNKQQALNTFWSGFDCLAFEENTVPDDDAIQAMIEAGLASSKFPYITYQVMTDDISSPLMLTASIFDRSNSWERVDLLSNRIAQYIQNMDTIKLDEGRLFITKGTPFSNHMSEEGDSTIRRVVLNIGVQFLTAY